MSRNFFAIPRSKSNTGVERRHRTAKTVGTQSDRHSVSDKSWRVTPVVRERIARVIVARKIMPGKVVPGIRIAVARIANIAGRGAAVGGINWVRRTRIRRVEDI